MTDDADPKPLTEEEVKAASSNHRGSASNTSPLVAASKSKDTPIVAASNETPVVVDVNPVSYNRTEKVEILKNNTLSTAQQPPVIADKVASHHLDPHHKVTHHAETHEEANPATPFIRQGLNHPDMFDVIDETLHVSGLDNQMKELDKFMV